MLAQVDPYLRSVRTRVSKCSETEEGRFEVLLDRTPFFPESGGQPSDEGTVGGLEVLALCRDDSGEVVHVLPGPVSGEVDAVLDWPRRFHFMQQHTAQHAITALASGRFGWETTAMHLGEERSDVEFAAPGLSIEALRPLEREVNELIRANRPIHGRFVDQAGFAGLGARSRRLPQDLEGDVRLVEIEGVDLNTCGGTHVSSTAEIQVCAFLGTEQLRGGTRVFFLAGDCALKLFDDLLDRQKALCTALTCGPEEHLPALAKLRESAKESERARNSLSRELSALLGRELSRQGSPVFLDRPDADQAFLKAIAIEYRKCAPEGIVLLAGGSGESGHFLLAGPVGAAAVLGPDVAAVLSARGGGSAGFYQGRMARTRDLGKEAEAFRQLVARTL
jgi:Ser-tRNA(Ala) deacylase AlaX